MITWKRAKVEVRNDHRRRIWESHCGEFRVVESRCLLSGDEPVRYFAMRPMGESWIIISRHRKREAAEQACEKLSEHSAVRA